LDLPFCLAQGSLYNQDWAVEGNTTEDGSPGSKDQAPQILDHFADEHQKKVSLHWYLVKHDLLVALLAHIELEAVHSWAHVLIDRQKVASLQRFLVNHALLVVLLANVALEAVRSSAPGSCDRLCYSATFHGDTPISATSHSSTLRNTLQRRTYSLLNQPSRILLDANPWASLVAKMSLR
jgi:hypothetical protein